MDDSWAAVALALLGGGGYAQIWRWRGQIETRLAQAEKDREILHERIGDKEDAIQEQLKALTAAVTDLKVEVAVLSEREKRK